MTSATLVDAAVRLNRAVWQIKRELATREHAAPKKEGKALRRARSQGKSV